ncbi:DNA-packaging protein [Microbulbifer sp. TYP-18]|uniref:DNA-packaging protein n=1 Tax=Microbulbifer sp. TYP-18 TaxID=3230024 RepID=UPI0034C63927
MAAPKGNQFWKARTRHGREKLFSSADALWEACCQYFEWVEANPLWEDKIVSSNGEPVSMPMFKMRAMTIEGLCLFLGITTRCWQRWRENESEDFVRVVERVDNVVREQKFTGAAAGLLNSNIIARDLGLKDQSTQELTGKDGGPIKHEHRMTPTRAREVLERHGIDPETVGGGD